MKKTISIFLLFLLIIPFINAKICRISGTSGDTIEDFGSSHSTNNIAVTLSSDSKSGANVKVTVKVTYKYIYGTTTITRSYTAPLLAMPLQTTICNIGIADKVTENGLTYEYQSHEIESITGVKCSE